jgi:hypothetical protein
MAIPDDGSMNTEAVKTDTKVASTSRVVEPNETPMDTACEREVVSVLEWLASEVAQQALRHGLNEIKAATLTLRLPKPENMVSGEKSCTCQLHGTWVRGMGKADKAQRAI